MKPAKYFYDKLLIDPKTVPIYLPHPVGSLSSNNFSVEHRICSKLKGIEDSPRVNCWSLFWYFIKKKPGQLQLWH
jgi:hypothetical protein